MATEDDDFQVLSDKIFNILALFFALCVAVFDFCVVLVSYVCRTSWALAYPPLKTFWDMLVPILNSEQDDSPSPFFDPFSTSHANTQTSRLAQSCRQSDHQWHLRDPACPGRAHRGLDTLPVLFGL